MSDTGDVDESLSDRSLNPYRGESETPLPAETASFVCLISCAIWALYYCDYKISLYPYSAYMVLLCYALLGIMRKHNRSMNVEESYEIFRVMASIIPMASMNAHMLRCNLDTSKSLSDFAVILTFAALPFILKLANPRRTDSIEEIVIWSNICTLGLNSIQHDFYLGMIATFWQGFFYLLTQNSHKWLLADPKIPFSLGLSGLCILLCWLYPCKL